MTVPPIFSYKPKIDANYPTLKTMCDDIYSQQPFIVDDKQKFIEGECLPRLVNLLFPKITDINYNIFIQAFICKYYNRSIFDENYNIFSFKLIELINTYYPVLLGELKINDLYIQLKNAKGSLTNEFTDTTDILNDTVYENTGNLSTKNTDNGLTNTNTISDGVEGKTSLITENSDNNATEKDTSRKLFSETPQSIVNATTIGNPSLTSWEYATNLEDNFNEKKRNDENNRSMNDKTDIIIHSTVKTDGTQQNISNGENISNSTGNSTETSKKLNDNTNIIENISEYELIKDKYNYLLNNLNSPMYIILEKFEPLFLSQFNFSDLGYISSKGLENCSKYLMFEG